MFVIKVKYNVICIK